MAQSDQCDCQIYNSANIFTSSAWKQIAEYLDCQYFWLHNTMQTIISVQMYLNSIAQVH